MIPSDTLYEIGLLVFGVLFLLAAWLPKELGTRPLSPPIVYVGLGLIVFSLPIGLPDPSPLAHGEIAERLSELVVINALFIGGLKLDRPMGWRSWGSTWRLLAVTMPLSIAAMALLGWWAVGLVPASALLLGAALAPTDPVLAEEVQVKALREAREDEVRFSLTSEAGLNDGLAFPFTNLAIAVALFGLAPEGWLGDWLRDDVVFKILVGTAFGVAGGICAHWFLFRLPFHHRLSRRRTGFVALGITLLIYGLTEVAGGYGFLSAFITPLMLRRLEPDSDYHDELHDYAEETEQMLRVTVLFLFGGSLAHGLLAALTWQAAFAGLGFLLIVRPLLGYAALAGSGIPKSERWAIAGFGIRGIGSFYYLAYGLNHAPFEQAELLWASVGFIVLTSILLHGISGSPAMRYIDRNWRRMEH